MIRLVEEFRKLKSFFTRVRRNWRVSDWLVQLLSVYMARRGTTVENLVAIMEKDKVLELSKEESHTVRGTAGTNLIARVCVPEKYPRREGFIKLLKRLWGMKTFYFAKLAYNAMVARFATEEDIDWVLRAGPWLCDDWVILVAEYDERMPISHIRLTTFRMWVHFYNLPLGCFTEPILKKVASAVGVYLDVTALRDDQPTEVAKAYLLSCL